MAKYKIYENPNTGQQESIKEGFNWLVFLFGPIWYFFNGMVGQGLGWLFVAFLVGSFTMGIGGLVVWILAGLKANGEKEKKYLNEGWKFVGYK